MQKEKLRDRKSEEVNIVIGSCFERFGEFAELLTSKSYLVKITAGLIGFSIFFYYCLSYINEFLIKRTIAETIENTVMPSKVVSFTFSHPFLTEFTALFVLYIPYVILSYPGVFMGDTETLLNQFLGNQQMVSSHHPIVYSYCFSGMLKFFNYIFHSWNFALFIVSGLQLITVLSVLSYGVALLVKHRKISFKGVIALTCCYCLIPRICSYMFLMTKDVLYSAFLLLMIETLALLPETGFSQKSFFILILSAAGAIVTRNEGIVVVIITLLFFSCFYDKHCFYCVAASIAVYVGIKCITLFNPSIIEESKREILSIPIQQTARTVKEKSDEMTQQEKETILSLFSFDTVEAMGEAYNENLSDPVKDKFVYNLDRQNASTYFRLWITMLKKYPLVYIDAFLSNNYGYFYPETLFTYSYSYLNSQEEMNLLNSAVSTDFEYPSLLAGEREAYQFVREMLARHSPMNILNSSGVLSWVLIFWFVLIIERKKYINILILVPLLTILFLCLLTPCNGNYCRYQFPILLSMPFVIFWQLPQIKLK